MSTGKFIASVLAGAAVGAVLGVLFAPDKGTETRRKIAQKGSDLAGSVKDKYHEFSDSISEKFDAAKEKLTGIVSEGKKMSHDIKNDIRNPKPVNS